MCNDFWQQWRQTEEHVCLCMSIYKSTPRNRIPILETLLYASRHKRPRLQDAHLEVPVWSERTTLHQKSGLIFLPKTIWEVCSQRKESQWCVEVIEEVQFGGEQQLLAPSHRAAGSTQSGSCSYLAALQHWWDLCSAMRYEVLLNSEVKVLAGSVLQILEEEGYKPI